MPLNVFQRLLRRWENVHPYNAAQAMELRGHADPRQWQEAWDAALATLGLGRPVVERERLRFEPLQASQPVTFLPADVLFETHITQGMNLPFAKGELPFRPFIKQLDGSYFAGVIYQHWLADSVAVRLVLREWFARVFDPSLARTQPIRLATEGYWASFGPHRLPWSMDYSAWATLRRFSRFRSVRRIRSAGSTDYTKAFLTRTAPGGIVPQLIEYAHRRGVRLNDLFLAAMVEQCAKYLPFRRTRRRRDIALGTIVDLRRLSRKDLSDTFGLFLGFTNVIVRDRDLADFDRLLAVIHAQNEVSRRTHAAAASATWLGISLLFSRSLTGHRSYQFYRKHMPLAGGISNVNMNRTWAAAYHPDPILRYVRASPTGPMIPVALAPTTLGNNLELALTYRASVLDAQAAERMMNGLIRRMDRCAEDGGWLPPAL